MISMALSGRKRPVIYRFGKPNGCFQRLVGKLGFVMGLVLRAQAFQNLKRFFERWRFDLTLSGSTRRPLTKNVLSSC
jgi:hypothetical protein